MKNRFQFTGIFIRFFLKDIEQTVNELHEKAHNLETLFLKCRNEILKDMPEQLIEEVSETTARPCSHAEPFRGRIRVRAHTVLDRNVTVHLFR